MNFEVSEQITGELDNRKYSDCSRNGVLATTDAILIKWCQRNLEADGGRHLTSVHLKRRPNVAIEREEI